MGFLIRTAFWFSLVMLIIPIDAGTSADGEAATPVGAIEAFVAARQAVGDVAGMCERQPDVCEVGRAALQTIGLRARESARFAYGFIEGDEVTDPVQTAGIPQQLQEAPVVPAE